MEAALQFPLVWLEGDEVEEEVVEGVEALEGEVEVEGCGEAEAEGTEEKRESRLE